VLDLSFLKLTPPILTTALSVQAQAATDEGSRWWLWLLLILLLSVGVAWLLGREGNRRTVASAAPAPSTHVPEPMAALPTATRAPVATTLVVESPAQTISQPNLETPVTESVPLQSVAVVEAPQPTVATAPVAVQPDDLTLVEGIGPKIKGVLNAAGVVTFADLARADAGELKKILMDAGLRIHNPTSWPEQAALAAAGQWDELKALQGRLSAGRRN
jgi:predicted flap endonuclease-1-like 5' DNA nuclease